MATSGSESRSGLVLELAEEFLERYRCGERPPLKEYVDRHPELAAEIHEVFPAMAMMEQIALADESLDGGAESTGHATARPGPRLERLGDYRIIREVGHGGMGVVYEAEQVSLGRHVALKVLPATTLRDDRRRRRFEREARAAARLHHTNIVPVFGVGEHEGTPYYAMQFIPGLGLDAVLDELRWMLAGAKPAAGMDSPGGPCAGRRDPTAADMARSLLTGRFGAAAPPDPGPAGETDGNEAIPPGPRPAVAPQAPRPPDPSSHSGSSLSILAGGPSGGRGPRSKRSTYWQGVARLGMQVADALDYAHKQGVVHRDIKPSNLLLDAQGTVWVADFGLAKADDQQALTHTGDILGTLRYMPPEAFEGRVDRRSDIYSLGLTLYEMLAFRPAFDEKDRGRLVRQVTGEAPPPLRKLNREVPRDLATIVEKAIDRDPAHRYGSSAELADDLRRFLDDEPIRVRPVPPWERIFKWAKRRPAVAVLVVLVHVLGAVSLGVFIWSYLKIHESLTEARTARDRAETLARSERRALGEARAQARIATDRAEDLAWEDYVNRVNRAYREVMDDNIALAEDLLHGCPPERRGWEWHYVMRRCHPERLALGAAGASVNAVAFSPDGRRIASGSGRSNLGGIRVGRPNVVRHVEIWDRETGRPRRVIRGRDQNVWGVAFSPDGRRLAICGQAPQVELRDATTGGLLWSSDEPGAPAATGVAFTPDGGSLVVAFGTYSGVESFPVRVFEAGTGRALSSFRGPKGGNNDLAIHPDGRRLAVAGEGVVEVWDLSGREKLRELPGHARWVYALAYSPDGRWLATGGWDGTIKLRDAGSGEELRTLFGHEGFVLDLAFSPDGRTLASTSEDRGVRLWEVPSGRPLGTLHGHTDFVVAVAFSPDGRDVASGGIDGILKVWDLRTSLPVSSEHTGWVSFLAFRRDGRRILSHSTHYERDAERRTRVWDPATGQPDPSLQPPIDASKLADDYPIALRRGWLSRAGRSAHVSLDGTLIARVLLPSGASAGDLPGGRTQSYVNSSVEILDAADGRVLRTLVGHTADVTELAFSPDGRRLATASLDRTVKLWDVATGREVFTLRGHVAGVLTLTFSPDGHRLASGGIDFTARVWDATPLPEDALRRQEARYRDKRHALSPPAAPGSAARWAVTLAETGDRERVLAAWERALRGTPEDLDLSLRLAGAFVSHGDEEGLLRLAERARERFADRTDAASLVRLGSFFRHAGRPGWAVAGYARAVEEAPDDLDLRQGFAMVLYEAGEVEALRREADDLERRFGDRLAGKGLLLRATAGLAAGRWDRAARDFGGAAAESPHDPGPSGSRLIALLEAGDAVGARRAAADLLERFGAPADDGLRALEAVRFAALSPEVDPQAPLRLAEAALARLPDWRRKLAGRELGAALYRAGRFEEAARTLEVGARAAGEFPVPATWAFLAMAHHRLGHPERARAWLDRARAFRPTSWGQVATAAEARLLLREAEALISGTTPPAVPPAREP